MEGLSACTAVGGHFSIRFPSPSGRNRSLSYRRPSRFRTLASREGPELDKWDQMELKFGRLLGEDPKLTLAKIMARKENPDVSYLDVEKSFNKNKGKLDDSMLDIPINVNVEGQHPSGLPTDLNLSRPAMREGGRTAAKLNLDNNKGKLEDSILDIPTNVNVERQQPSDLPANLNLSRPLMKKGGGRTTAQLNLSRSGMNRGVSATRPVERPATSQVQEDRMLRDVAKKNLNPSVSLRKPDVAKEDDIGPDKRLKLKIKPNMVLKMRKDSDESLSNVPLLKKPEAVLKPLDPVEDDILTSNPIQAISQEAMAVSDAVKPLNASGMLREKPEMSNAIEASDGTSDRLDTGLQLPEQSVVESHEADASPAFIKKQSMDDSISQQASLIGKPQRLESLDSYADEVLQPTRKVIASSNEEGHSSNADMIGLIPAEQKEREDKDWRRAEHLFHTGERAEVELISCSGRGFVVSFGSIVGFLPYRNLGAKWKFLAFESWLRQKGLDPSVYRQNMSIMGSYDIPNKNLATEPVKGQDTVEKIEEILSSPALKFEDLLEAYDKEKTKFLSSFIGLRIKASVVLADRNSRKLMFSGRPKENEELVKKKRSLMGKLSVGDVVKCSIKKITYFGIFVEVEGVPALIHQSEISWDASLDPSSYYKIGQIVEAKVHQLDYALERITLSLKEITPDPLMEALESVIGDHNSLEGSLEAAQADIEPWADVESLIEELQQIDGVQSVSKGRFFLSPGLAPTFQVYMASVFDNQYKLLARYGNKVQEVMVQASLDKEQMKGAILTCTNRVQ